MFVYDYIQVMHPPTLCTLARICISDDMSFSKVSCLYCLFVPNSGDTSFDQQNKLVSDFSTVVSNFLPIIASKQFLRRYFETMQMSYSSNSLPRFSISWWFLPKPVFSVMFAKWKFSKTTTPFIFTSWHLELYQSPHLSVCLFTYLPVISMDVRNPVLFTS